jgi:hypothetical protein
MRSFLSVDQIGPLLRPAFGSRAVAGLARLDGGTAKGVYRVTFADGGSVLIYRWHADENFWPARVVIGGGPFGGDPGREAFVAKHSLLSGLGVRVPHLLGLAGSDLALIEDVRNGTLEHLLAHDAAAGRETLARLRETLRAMHTHTSPDFGWPGRTCAEFVMGRARRASAEAVARVPRIAAIQDRLGYELSRRYAAIQPRSVHGVIHGELGPDHVMVGDSGEPVLIDIESTMAFDVEWEHAFLEIRFGPLYQQLHTVELDPARMSLYRLTHYLSLVAGPLMLLDGDFPRPEIMREIVAGNVERVLSAVAAG